MNTVSLTVRLYTITVTINYSSSDVPNHRLPSLPLLKSHRAEMMSPLPSVLWLLLCSVSIPAMAQYSRQSCQPPTEYRHTLSDLSQQNVLRCSSLPSVDRLPCELNAALDAQGHRRRPPTSANNKQAETAIPARSKSCKFREDNIYSLYPYAMPSSPLLDATMEKYTAMHERCMNTDYSLLNQNIYINSSNIRSTTSKIVCQYLLWRTNEQGLGNRLLSLISAFLYAILSARVLLIDYPEYDGLFCEPFHGSTIHIPPKSEFDPRIGPTYLSFRNSRCGTCGVNANSTGTNNGCNSSVVNLVLHYRSPVRQQEAISCPMGYARLRNVLFVTWSDNQIYLVPGFYANPVLSPLLDALFPQRNPFHLLSRFILVPNDGMWARIRSHLDGFAGRRIGVQVREFEYWKNNKTYTKGFDANIVGCIVKKGGLLPNYPIREKAGGIPLVTIYMATLVKCHLEAMKSNLQVLTGLTGHEFRLRFQKNLGDTELHDLMHQQEAMVDVWVLSFSHVLMTTKGSTFGYVAGALSGLTRTLLADEVGDEGCSLGVGPEPCGFHAPLDLSCVEDEPVKFNIADVMARNDSKVRVCTNNWGWVLVPENVILG